MKWLIKDYKKMKRKYPNIYKHVAQHGHFFQARSDYGDVSGMFKYKKDAISWARKKNKTKTFSYTESERSFHSKKNR